MDSKLKTTFLTGLNIIRENTKLLMIGVLVLVFPIVFFSITQGFLGTASDNIGTIQKQKISIIHESLATMIRAEGEISVEQIQSYLQSLATDQADIKNLTVFRKENEGFTISYVYDVSPEELRVPTAESFVVPPVIFEEDSIINYSVSNGLSLAESYRQVTTDEGVFYTYVLQDFTNVDQVLYSRVQEAYLGLTLVLFFLIGLAYWLNRQTFWQGEYLKKEKEIESRDMFSNMIAHEFRTPLTAIKGYASFLRESEAVKGEDSRFVSNISQSTERLIYLVNDFLEVAKLQSGKIVFNKKPLQLAMVIEKTLSDLEPIARDKGLKLQSHVPENIQLDSDESRLQQVLINLVTNAIKYTDKGEINVSVTEDRDLVNINIQDTGLGISGEDQKKLFKPFSRVGSAESSGQVGTGLGMWITEQLVRLLGGQINLESLQGVGTKVTISFKKD